MRILPAERGFSALGVKYLNRGFPAVLPTDTLYGICADALNPEAVEKIYTLKWRNPKKPLIVLIAEIEWVRKFFKTKLSRCEEKLLNFEKPLSVLVKVENFDWISRGKGEIAFRLVKKGFIKDFLLEFGKPIVAPSANWEGFPPAKDIFQAFLYFGSSVAVYYNGGVLSGKPSSLVRCGGEKIELLREGTTTLEEIKNLI